MCKTFQITFHHIWCAQVLISWSSTSTTALLLLQLYRLHITRALLTISGFDARWKIPISFHANFIPPPFYECLVPGLLMYIKILKFVVHHLWCLLPQIPLLEIPKLSSYSAYFAHPSLLKNVQSLSRMKSASRNSKRLSKYCHYYLII